MVNTIRGLVYSKYGSGREFARVVGWNRSKACAIVNGKQEPKISDLTAMAPALDITVGELAHIFLHEMSQNCDQNKE